MYISRGIAKSPAKAKHGELCNNSQRLKAVNYGCKALYLRSLLRAMVTALHTYIKPVIMLKNGQTFLKFCDVNTARFLNYVWPFFNIMNERVKVKRSRKKTPVNADVF